MLTEAIYPKGGWRRAFEYVKHRVRRLPDTPEKIARGVWCGVLASFTPFYGIHFVVAIILVKPMRGNLLAAVLATFFGNPVTIFPISLASLNTGYFLLGTRPQDGLVHALPQLFAGAGRDLWHNIRSVFNGSDVDWDRLAVFYDEVFFPLLVGGIIPGIVVATICYYLTVPLIAAYQNRRRSALRAKLDQLRNNAVRAADGGPPAR